MNYEKFKAHIHSCKNEEELKILFATKILSSIDLKLEDIRHELSVIKGRLDSLYGTVILEFKAPGEIPAFKSDKKFINIKDQVSKHITGISTKNKIDKKKIIGIIFDGFRLAYQYEVEDNTIIRGPYNLNEENFKHFIQKLITGLNEPKALISENLINDFGFNSQIYIESINEIYNLIDNHKIKKTSILFDQWKIYFKEICGYDFNSDKNVRVFSKNFYGIKKPKIELLAFSIHTYYSILLNFIALQIGNILSKNFDPDEYFELIKIHKDKELQKTLENIFDGKPFKDIGFSNLIETTFFHWFIYEKSKIMENLIKKIAILINSYSTQTLKIMDLGENDILRDLYQSISPKELRHALGEYYTPDWLAEYVIEKSGYVGAYDSKILDPTCGSGTFLSKIILKFKNYNKKLSKKVIVKGILKNINGIDLNPLAVTSSKINYLISIGEDLLTSISYENIEIPVFLSDSMLAPLEHKFEKENHYIIPTKVGNFKLQKNFVSNKKFSSAMTKLHEAVLNKWSFVETKNLMVSELNFSDREVDLYIGHLFNQLSELDKKGINGVWCNIIKNFFSPTFIKNIDFIIGNPPWVNWQNLPEFYRTSIKKYWSHYAYNLFRHKGLEARLGSAHDDICVLLTYIVSDVFLKTNGIIAFLLPQNLFKSKGGGEGFRLFKIKNSFDLGVISVDDLVDLNPFDANSKPSLFIAQKGKKNKYPVDYFKWEKPNKWKSKQNHLLETVKKHCIIVNQEALPIDKNDITSPWITGKKHEINFYRNLVGQSFYRARKGVDTSLNGVFWVKKLETQNKLSKVINCISASRTSLKQTEFWIEKKTLYPLLRGKDFSRWNYKCKYHQILLYDTKTGKPLKKNIVMRNFPKAWRYFEKPSYKTFLFRRGIYNKHLKNLNYPQYACFDIGPYTFSKYKVVWKAIANSMQSVVIEKKEDKTIIPDHNVVMIPFDNLDEAHYVCSIINSDICTNFVNSYIEWFFSAHILKYFNIPKYDKSSLLHKKISQLSKLAHTKTTSEYSEIESEINVNIKKMDEFKN